MVHRNSEEPSAYSKNDKNNEENNVGPNSAYGLNTVKMSLL